MKIAIEAAINVPDKPAEFETISQADWEKIMKNIWLHWWATYYQQYQEEINSSLSDFTTRVFQIAEEKSKLKENPDGGIKQDSTG
jgi:hypothetical protein